MSSESSHSLYIGGTFGFSTKTPEPEDIRQDFRHRLVGDALLREQSVKIGKSVYTGCFYYYPEGDSQTEIVKAEMAAIRKADTVFLVFPEGETQGTVSELLYAAELRKRINVFYVAEPKDARRFQTRFWWPFSMAELVDEHVSFRSFPDYDAACSACIDSVLEVTRGD